MSHSMYAPLATCPFTRDPDVAYFGRLNSFAYIFDNVLPRLSHSTNLASDPLLSYRLHRFLCLNYSSYAAAPTSHCTPRPDDPMARVGPSRRAGGDGPIAH